MALWYTWNCSWASTLNEMLCSSVLGTEAGTGGFWLIDWLIHLQLGLRHYGPDATRPWLTGPLWPILIYGSPVALLKFQMAPRLTIGPPDLQSECPLTPRRRRPDKHVWEKPKLHTHRECGLRFHPLLHTSYTLDCLTAPLGEDVSSGCYVQWDDQ